MVRKKLAMAVLALSALQADLASALGLGNLSVKSALNQPLNAEIKLLDTADLDPSQIKVQLAAPEDFERAGVDRSFFLTNLKFVVDIDGRGTGMIRITTADPVVEPYLNFVVEARWPNGRLLREFAVLLDPPTFSGGAAQPAVRAAAPAAQPGSARPTRDLEPPRVSSQPAAPSTAERIESNTLPESGKASEHRVQVNETLSQIAAQNRPSGVTVQQTMVAIQRGNPDAFINGNINLIKSGSVLRLPGAEDAAAVGAAAASEQIAAQTHAWRSGAASTETATGPQLDASQGSAPEAGAGQDRERLTIATPGSSDKSSVGEGNGKASKQLEGLRNQLSASQESLDSAKRDNKELQSRLDDMERQVATLQRLISLKDDQLAALQSKSNEQGKTAAPAIPAAPNQEPVAQAPAAAEPAPSVAATPAPQPAAPAPAAPTAAPKPVPKAAPKPAPEPTFIEKLTSQPLYWGGALAALALLLGGALVAKKRRELAEEESAYESLDLQDYTDSTETPEQDLDTAVISDEAIVPAAAASSFAASEPEKKPLRSETGDAIAEADIYIAYGRYQQAVDLLVGAIDAEPDRTDLRVKLLEVYLEMRNRDAFRQQFMGLQSLGNSQAVAQVKEMLSSVDGVSGWLDELPQGASGGSDFGGALAAGAAIAAGNVAADATELGLGDEELDLDLDFVDETQTATAEQTLAPLPEEALDDLELDLDLDADFGDELAAPSATAAAAEPEFAVDFGAAEASGPSALADAGLTLDLDSEDDLELDLDDEELDLELNEEDLDFALRAMAGDKAEGETGLADNAQADTDFGDLADGDELAGDFDLPDFNTPEFGGGQVQSESTFEAPASEPVALDSTPSFELPEESLDSFALADDLDAGEEPAAAVADELKDFDLSLAAAEFTAPETEASELADLGNLDDFDFAAESPAQENVPAAVEQVGSAELTSAVGDDFDFLADTDEVATKLDLARAYIDMGDTDGAKDILDEVLQEGSDVQKQEANELMDRIA